MLRPERGPLPGPLKKPSQGEPCKAQGPLKGSLKALSKGPPRVEPGTSQGLHCASEVQLVAAQELF